MDALRSLYEEVILDHNRNPRYFNKKPELSNRHAHGDNPLCGDHYTLDLYVKDGRIEDVGFAGEGCAISKASASLMLEHVKGKSEAEALAVFSKIHAMLTNDSDEIPDMSDMRKLKALSGVREFPMRVKCATLSWHVLKAALDNNSEDTIQTE